uniref:LEM domain-containing protein n=1 Tax=Oryzias latipes TaxID=8090 RepID=A0A3P9H5R0_ORYLA
MSSFSNMSAEEISYLLDEHGIKHGPVVDSTRNLYEKKLKEAMAKKKQAKPSPDKTFYREEEEEVTYVYRTPTKSENFMESRPYMRSKPEWTAEELEHSASYSGYSRSSEYRGRDYDELSHKLPVGAKTGPIRSGQDAPKAPKSPRLIPLWVQFLCFLAVAVFLYFVFSSMESSEPLKVIE